MRKKLKESEGVRGLFRGTFTRFGTKNGWRGPEKTVLLNNIENDEGTVVSDHCWFNYTKGFQSLHLKEGDRIEFQARVKEYLKGYQGYREEVYKPVEIDYKLSHPTKLKKVICNEKVEKS